MKRESLFENRAPIARNADPATSVLAGEAITENGTRDSQKHKILAFLKQQTVALTSSEIAVQGGWLPTERWRFIVARRLPDLKRDGYVVRGPARRCDVTGYQCLTWRVNHAK
jgi:hypothetical protein